MLDEWDVRIAGHREIDYGTQYYLERGQESVRLNVFTTGKVTVQGKNSGLGICSSADWRHVRRSTPPPAESYPVRAGLRRYAEGRIDEAGKGITSAAGGGGCQGNGRESRGGATTIGRPRLEALGVIAARATAEGILEILGENNVRAVTLSPREYEARRRAAGNVNKLLDEIDAWIIAELKDDVELIVVDQYAVSARERLEPFVSEGVKLEVRKRAEDDAAVAAASILARARYLEELERLGTGWLRAAARFDARSRCWQASLRRTRQGGPG